MSRLLIALKSLRFAYQKPEPWNAFVPFLVTTFMTEPAARPYSAENWFVIRRISETVSVLLMGCWRPVTLGSLLSWPSIMKLLERVRMPLVAKSGPETKSAWPVFVWLTPAACSASENTSRALLTGSSAMRLVSKRTPTSALFVLSSAESASTVIVSLTAAAFMVTSTTASWLSARLIPDRTIVAKPLSAMVTS